MSVKNSRMICENIIDDSLAVVIPGRSLNLGETDQEYLNDMELNQVPDGYIFKGFILYNNLPTAPQEHWYWSDNNVVVNNVKELDAIKEEAYDAIDEAAEATRLRYVTRGSAQALTYLEKSDDAANYIAAGYPAALTLYPFINAEVNATGKSPSVAANDIISQRNTWIVLAAGIEETRLSGKTNVMAATNVVAVETIKDATIAVLQGI